MGHWIPVAPKRLNARRTTCLAEIEKEGRVTWGGKIRAYQPWPNRSKIVKQFGLKPSNVYVKTTWNIVPNVNTLNFLLKDVNNNVTAIWLLYRWMRACPLEKIMGIHGDESGFRELRDQGEGKSNRKGRRPTEKVLIALISSLISCVQINAAVINLHNQYFRDPSRCFWRFASFCILSRPSAVVQLQHRSIYMYQQNFSWLFQKI